jgi:hypothetical protein
MNVQTLKTKIKEASLENEFRDFIEEHWEGSELKIGDLLLKIEVSERENENMVVIFKIEDKYFRINGTYDSWDGTRFYDILNNFYEVKPVQKTITVFEAVS